MQFDEIYAAGKQDWIKALHTLSPELAQRVESDRLSLAHALHLIGVHTGAFEHTERSTMDKPVTKSLRFITSDDVVFDDIETAEVHAAELLRMDGLHLEVDAYLDTMTWEDTTGRARTREKNSIQRWLEHDVNMHPERYAEDD